MLKSKDVKLKFTSKRALILKVVLYFIYKKTLESEHMAILNKASFKQIMEYDQYAITKKGIFVGKSYACAKMFKINIENNKLYANSIYLFSFINS